MSATREKLVEQIVETEEAISAIEANGQVATTLRERLASLREQLAATNQALTEGTVLKG